MVAQPKCTFYVYSSESKSGTCQMINKMSRNVNRFTMPTGGRGEDITKFYAVSIGRTIEITDNVDRTVETS